MVIFRKHTITTRIEKGGRDPQAWITIALLIGDNSLELRKHTRYCALSSLYIK